MTSDNVFLWRFWIYVSQSSAMRMFSTKICVSVDDGDNEDDDDVGEKTKRRILRPRRSHITTFYFKRQSTETQ